MTAGRRSFYLSDRKAKGYFIVSVKRIAVLRGKVKDEIIAFVKQCRVYVVIVKYMEAA